MIRLDLLPAADGDCLLVTAQAAQRPINIVVDVGRPPTASALRAHLIDRQIANIDLLVVTHVDQDHITGLLRFLEDDPPPIHDVWFNGYRHLRPGDEQFGPVDGERLTDALLTYCIPWNKAFDGSPVTKGCVHAADGVRITVLAPTTADLGKFEPQWETACARAGLTPGVEPPEMPPPAPGWERLGGAPDPAREANARYAPDTSAANATSIVLLIETAHETLLLTADAHADTVERGVRELRERRTIDIGLAQLPHHGSAHNTNASLIETLQCDRFAVSSNGTTDHRPSAAAIARAALHSPKPVELHFNYRASADRARQLFAHTDGVTVHGPSIDDADGYTTITV